MADAELPAKKSDLKVRAASAVVMLAVAGLAVWLGFAWHSSNGATLAGTFAALLAVLLLIGSVSGAQVGAQLAEKLPAERLRFVLAAIVLVIALRMALIEGFGDDNYVDGQVIIFVKKFPQRAGELKDYSFVAVKGNNNWFTNNYNFGRL